MKQCFAIIMLGALILETPARPGASQRSLPKRRRGSASYAMPTAFPTSMPEPLTTSSMPTATRWLRTG